MKSLSGYERIKKKKTSDSVLVQSKGTETIYFNSIRIIVPYVLEVKDILNLPLAQKALVMLNFFSAKISANICCQKACICITELYFIYFSGGLLYGWWKPQYPDKTTNLSQGNASVLPNVIRSKARHEQDSN